MARHIVKKRICVYEIHLDAKEVRETAKTERICDSGKVAKIAHAVIGDSHVERFLAIMLNARHQLLGIHLVSIGTLNSSTVHPREVFLPAISIQAAAIIVAHNHPSGDVTPSPDDRSVTERLRKSGALLGIEVLDHVIVTVDPYKYYSFTSELMHTN